MIGNVEISTIMCHDCATENVSKAECEEKINTGKQSLSKAKKEIDKLEGLIRKFEANVLSKLPE